MCAHKSAFAHKVRVRACGLLVRDDAVLSIQLTSPVTQKLIWMPPGGGVEFGESITDCLKREFKEETNLKIAVKGLVHIHQLVKLPFHAVECFFEVEKLKGEPSLGKDPELSEDQQLIKRLQWIPINELAEYDFEPESLLPILKQWEYRSSAEISVGLN